MIIGGIVMLLTCPSSVADGHSLKITHKSMLNCNLFISNIDVLAFQSVLKLLLQSGRENFQGSETQQLEIIQGSEGETAEVDISSQPQILITQGSGTGRDEGKSTHVNDLGLCEYRLLFKLKVIPRATSKQGSIMRPGQLP